MQEIKKEECLTYNRKLIGKTIYLVTYHYKETGGETIQDKIKRMILRDIQKGNY